MSKIIKNLLYIIAGVWILSAFVYGFIAYFVTGSADNGAVTDGLGRTLFQTPALLRLIFGEERFYPGFGWFIFDMVAFWGSLVGAMGLVRLGEKVKSSPANDE